MLCRERGLLSLDDPMSKYLPEVPYDGINLRQMLTHTSGLPEQNELMYKYWNSEKPVTNRDMLEYLIKYKPPVAFQPGESFKYCNTNYSLLALVVEKVSGQTFQQFVTENIFAPLKLRHTQFLNPNKTIPHLTENYIFDPETKQLLPPKQIPQWKKAVPLTGLVGAGNIHSTIVDLLAWQESLNNATILKRESILEMETPHVEANVDGSDAYGYGLAIKSLYGDTKIFHYGGAQLNKFIGTYQAANGNSFSIENRNGKLFRVVATGERKELKAESPSKLFYDDESDRQIEFVFDKHGVKVRFISQGLVTELKKVQ